MNKQTYMNLSNPKITIFFSLLIVFLACGSDSDTDVDNAGNNNSGNNEETNYDISTILNIFDNVDAITYYTENNILYITTTDVPNHKSPYFLDTDWHNEMYEDYNGSNNSFHLNPNRISEQNISFEIPLHPKEATSKEETSLGPIGISRNGVVFFNQYAGPNNQPLTNEINSFDQFNGHPAGQGNYHYHIEPTYLTATYGEDAILGLLADGFPVYGPVENGSAVTNEDLDDYHGHTHSTDDFPNGIYHYHITSEDPYINGSGYFGEKGNINR